MQEIVARNDSDLSDHKNMMHNIKDKVLSPIIIKKFRIKNFIIFKHWYKSQ
jgi:hypothetical protein